MEEKNVDVQDVDLEQEEEETTQEVDETEEETITVSKDKFKAMQRKAMAYDAGKKAPKKEPIINKEDSLSKDVIERLELRVDGYPEKVIDEIVKLGGKKALSNPLIKKVADDMTAQYKAELATNIESSSKSDIDTKYSQAELKGKSLEELEKILPHAGE